MQQYYPGRKLRIVVTGVAGFIGSHLGRELRAQGHYVVGADWDMPSGVPLQETCNEFYYTDLRLYSNCAKLLSWPADSVHVFHFAAHTGGVGFAHANAAASALNNSMVDANMLEAARRARVERFFYASSAREEPVAGADPCGLQKRLAEELCLHYGRDHGMRIRIARLHGVYGPQCPWHGGREGAPAALCRKVAAGRHGDPLQVWGDGRQTRGFVYVDDAVEGVLRLMMCDDPRVEASPVNLGSDEAVAVADVARMVMRVAGKSMPLAYDPGGPRGARTVRTSRRQLREVLGWEPTTSLHRGIAATYGWVQAQVHARARARPDRLAAMRCSQVMPVAEPRSLT